MLLGHFMKWWGWSLRFSIVVCLSNGVIVQALFHPRKIRNQTAKPMKNDAYFQGTKRQKTWNQCSPIKPAQTFIAVCWEDLRYLTISEKRNYSRKTWMIGKCFRSSRNASRTSTFRPALPAIITRGAAHGLECFKPTRGSMRGNVQAARFLK